MIWLSWALSSPFILSLFVVIRDNAFITASLRNCLFIYYFYLFIIFIFICFWLLPMSCEFSSPTASILSWHCLKINRISGTFTKWNLTHSLWMRKIGWETGKNDWSVMWDFSSARWLVCFIWLACFLTNHSCQVNDSSLLRLLWVSRFPPVILFFELKCSFLKSVFRCSGTSKKYEHLGTA